MGITDNYFIKSISGNNFIERQRALEHFYKDHTLEKMVAGYVRKKGGTDEDALEVLYTIYPKFEQSVRDGKFNGKSKLTTYFWGFIKNGWYEQCRKNAKNKTLDFKLPLDVPKASDADLLEEEVDNIFDKVITLVKERCQKLFRYTKLGYSQKEIATLIDSLSSPNMVKKELSRCRKRLNKHLDKNPDIKRLLDLYIKNLRNG